MENMFLEKYIFYYILCYDICFRGFYVIDLRNLTNEEEIELNLIFKLKEIFLYEFVFL